jgi:XisH protein
MAARNVHHDAVVEALVADGWTITDDPLKLSFGNRKVYVDIGAQRAIGAEKGDRRIAVEVQSFLGLSEVHDLEGAIGQYVLYRTLLRVSEPDRALYMAVRPVVADGILAEPIGRLLLEEERIKVVVFDSAARRIVKWTE